MQGAEINTGSGLASPVPRPVVLLAASIPLFALAQALGDSLRFSDEFLTTIWPPAGVLVALLWLAPARVWAGLVATFVVVEGVVAFGVTRTLDDFGWALFFPAVSALGAVLVVALLRRRGMTWPDFGRVGQVAEFLAIAALTGPVLAGLLGASVYGTFHPGRSILLEALKFWCGDVLGILVLAPLVASWLCPEPDREPLRQRWPELAALTVTVVAAAVFAAWLTERDERSWVEVSHVVLPFLVWACLRFDARIVSLLLALAGAIVVRSAIERGGGDESLVAMQTYLLVGTSTMLLLSSAVQSGNRLRRRGLEVSAQKLEAERRLWKARRTEDLGRLASGVVHDFNNLLMVVRANALLAQRSRPGEVEYKSALDGIHQAVDRGAEELKRLLVFGRDRPTTDTPQRLDLAVAMRAAADLLRPALPSWIRLEVAVESEPLWIDGVEPLLEQALVNLGLNARDQITRADPGRRGTITFQASSDQGRERPLTITVRSVGVGPVSNPSPSSTAHGLAVVVDVVQQHGGTLDVEVPSEGGSAVRLRFPAARLSAPMSPARR